MVNHNFFASFRQRFSHFLISLTSFMVLDARYVNPHLLFFSSRSFSEHHVQKFLHPQPKIVPAVVICPELAGGGPPCDEVRHCGESMRWIRCQDINVYQIR